MSSSHKRVKVRDSTKKNIGNSKEQSGNKLRSGKYKKENQDCEEFSISAHSSDPGNILNNKDLGVFNPLSDKNDSQNDDENNDEYSINAEESKSDFQPSHLGDLQGKLASF